MGPVALALGPLAPYFPGPSLQLCRELRELRSARERVPVQGPFSFLTLAQLFLEQVGPPCPSLICEIWGSESAVAPTPDRVTHSLIHSFYCVTPGCQLWPLCWDTVYVARKKYISIKSVTYHKHHEQADEREDYTGNAEPGEEVVSMLRGVPGHEPAHRVTHKILSAPLHWMVWKVLCGCVSVVLDF